MLDPASALFLGALPDEGGYLSPVKIALYLALMLLWAHTSAWVQKDARKIRAHQALWNAVVFGGGAFALLLWLLLPSFWVSLIIYVLTFGSAAISYVVYHNKRVSPAQSVLTPAHFQRIMGGRTKHVDASSQDRVRIRDAEDKAPEWPSDPEEHAGYQALQELLFDAIWRRASDVRIDLVPQQGSADGSPANPAAMKIVYRIDGVDRAREPIEPEVAPLIFKHLKRIAGANPDEHRRPQTGRFSTTIGAGGQAEKNVSIEMKTSGSTAGQRMILKLVSEEQKYRLPDVGFTEDQLKRMEELIQQPRGVIIASGPSGSGVTSTLYAILRAHDAYMQNIHSLEIERTQELENITQHLFDSQGGTISFGKQMRSVLRTEPDVFMASDVPDSESAALAAAGAKQGKKIYLGISASDTFSALKKYLQGVNDNKLAASSLLAVLNQRLVRRVCYNCRRAYKPDPNLLRKANLPTDQNRPFYRPPKPEELEVDKRGDPILCAICQGSGYLGRSAVIEMLIMTDDLRALVAKGAALAAVRTQARKDGMLYLQEVALHKVFEGVTSINEVLRVTKQQPPATAKAS